MNSCCDHATCCCKDISFEVLEKEYKYCLKYIDNLFKETEKRLSVFMSKDIPSLDRIFELRICENSDPYVTDHIDLHYGEYRREYCLHIWDGTNWWKVYEISIEKKILVAQHLKRFERFIIHQIKEKIDKMHKELPEINKYRSSWW